MPILRSSRSVLADDITGAPTFSGLILLRPNVGQSSLGTGGLGDDRNLLISVADGAVEVVNLASKRSILNEISLPTEILPSGSTVTYQCGWFAGITRFLRANYGVSVEAQDATDAITIPSFSTVDVADLWGFRDG